MVLSDRSGIFSISIGGFKGIFVEKLLRIGEKSKLKKKIFLNDRIFEEFWSNRAEKLYTYSSKGMDGPRALHFPKFVSQINMSVF